MRRGFRVAIATVLPLGVGALAWWACAALGLDGDTAGIVVGLVVLVPGTPLAIWAGQSGQGEPFGEGTPCGVPEVIGDVPCAPRAFQRRPELRARVEAILDAGGAAPVCVLVGARGVGKTQLAAAHARDCTERGIPVAWLHAQGRGQLAGSLDLMAAELGLANESDTAGIVVRKIRTWLRGRREPVLLVLDDADDPDALTALLPSHGPARVLITTNDLAFERIAPLVPVDRYTEREALSFLRERTGETNEAAARALIAELDRLPLALSVASAALLGPPRLGCDAYLELVRATPVEVLLERPRGEPYPRGVGQAIALSAEGVSQRAMRLLGELSVLSTSGTEPDLLRPDDRLALTELGSVSLVAFTEDTRTVLVHRLVRRVIQDRAERDGSLPALLAGAARRLEFVAGIPERDIWRRRPTIIAVSEHAACVWRLLDPLLDGNPHDVQAAAESVLLAQQAMAAHLLELEDGDRAVQIARAAVAGRERYCGPDHPATLSARYTLAHTHEAAGRPAAAVELYEDVVARSVRVFGESAPQTLRHRAGQASAMTGAGRAQEALDLLDMIVTELSCRLEPDHPDLLHSREFQAMACTTAGPPGRAVALFASLAADHQRLYGTDHPDTLMIRGYLAGAHRTAGHNEAAMRLYEQIVTDQERVVGADHPATLSTRHSLAAVYEAEGRIEDALFHYEHVAEQRHRVLGPGRASTIAARQDAARLRRRRTGQT